MTRQKQNEIYKEITKLSKVIPQAHQLDRHQLITAVNDAFMKLIEKEQEGVINLDEYDHYKGYMFITIRNAIFRNFQYQKTLKGESEQIFFESSIHQEPCVYLDVVSDIRYLVNKLPPIQRAVYRWFKRGWTYSEIARAFGWGISKVQRILHQVRKVS